MKQALRYLGQGIWYLVFVVSIGYFSESPSYTHLDPEKALIKLAISHPGRHITPCRKRTEEELAALPKHMRVKMDCPRERSPIYVELALDGEQVFSQLAQPAGLSKDGKSSIYQRIPVLAGDYQLRIGMRDHVDDEGFTFAQERSLTLKPQQVLVVDFNPESKQFTFH